MRQALAPDHCWVGVGVGGRVAGSHLEGMGVVHPEGEEEPCSQGEPEAGPQVPSQWENLAPVECALGPASGA